MPPAFATFKAIMSADAERMMLVVRVHRGFVGHHGHLAKTLEPSHAFEISAGDRLLQHRYADIAQARQHPRGSHFVPTLVRIKPDLEVVGQRAHKTVDPGESDRRF